LIFAWHINFRSCELQTQFLSLSLFFLPAALAARAAASGPASDPSSWGGGAPSRLASSLLLAASPSALLASLMCVAPLVGRQLAGQPERGRYRPGRRRRRGLHRFGRREGGRPHRDHRFQPRPLVGWLGRLAADDACPKQTVVLWPRFIDKVR
jgi:hypothetical protein